MEWKVGDGKLGTYLPVQVQKPKQEHFLNQQINSVHWNSMNE